MDDVLPVVTVGRKGEERLRGGHLWVYGDDLREIPTGLPPGTWVRAASRAGQFLGTGTLNLSSRISLRIVSRGEALPSEDFLSLRIAQARERRAAAGMDTEGTLRVVYSEGDFLPGLVVDKYGPLLVVQVMTAGMERVREPILSALVALYSPRLVYERSEGAGRRLEGLPERRGPAWGVGPPREEVDIDGIRYLVDAEAGPKTGFFLDQRANRTLVRARARGRTVLDAFCATGAFGLSALAGGAARVVAVDASEGLLEAARGNAARNGFGNRWEGLSADLFDALRRMDSRKERFDLVVLDPPAFAKSREDLPGALRGYRDINRLGIRLLSPDGLLATSSCTQPVDVAKWREALRLAAADAGADLELLASGGQPPDHPVLLGVPETEYLKFALFRKRIP